MGSVKTSLNDSTKKKMRPQANISKGKKKAVISRRKYDFYEHTINCCVVERYLT